MPKLFENDRGEACLRELERLLAIFPKLKGSNETDELLLARPLKSETHGRSRASRISQPVLYRSDFQEKRNFAKRLNFGRVSSAPRRWSFS